MSFDWILAVLPWLALLACPAMMFWCMRGMRGGSGGACDRDAGATSDADKDQEIRALKARLDELEARKNTEEWSRPSGR